MKLRDMPDPDDTSEWSAAAFRELQSFEVSKLVRSKLDEHLRANPPVVTLGADLDTPNVRELVEAVIRARDEFWIEQTATMIEALFASGQLQAQPDDQP